MRISFSMDGIKNMDRLYTYTLENHPEFGDVRSEHYHGDDYCKNIITDILKHLAASDWVEPKYLGSRERMANETFILPSIDGSEYNISFGINTYNGEAARLEVAITARKTDFSQTGINVHGVRMNKRRHCARMHMRKHLKLKII